MGSSGLSYLYVPASDLRAMREFYGTVGLEEIYFSEVEGAFAYSCAGFSLRSTFSR